MSRSLNKNLIRLFVTCGGLGYLPKGSGTLASAVALVFWWGVLGAGASPMNLVALVVALTVTGAWAVRSYEQGKSGHDSSEIVIDEWVGMGIAFLPLAVVGPTGTLAVSAFLLFRFFDIAKPMGVRFFDRNYLRGWGVILDDVVAGIYSALILGVWLWWTGSTLNLN